MNADTILELHRSFEKQAIGISAYIRALTYAIDEVLISLWEKSGLSELDTHLVALGGFGRQELFPYSDVDALVLIPELNSDIENGLARFNEAAWDAGFKLNLNHEYLHQPRLISDVDLSMQTCWLESRLIAGDPIDYSRWHYHILQSLDAGNFIQSKIFEQQQRHIKYEEAQASLEPNVKEHPGGLRDLHTLLWIDRARHGKRTLDQLLLHYGFSHYEIRRIQRAQLFLSTLRAHLHLITKRQEDTLRYDLHLVVAERLGIHRNATRLLASERLMQHYYRMSRLIQQANQLIISHIQNPVPPIPPAVPTPFFVDNHQLCINDALSVVEEPALLFEIFVKWQVTPEAQDIHPLTQRILWDYRHLLDAPQLELRERLQKAFITIMKGPRLIHRCLRYLHILELLERYLPDWQRIRGHFQHDYMHRYPIDEHNLMVVRYLRRMVDPRFRDELPEASAFIKAFKRPEVLWIAGLFHDIGKGLEGDHSKLGAAKVRSFAESHQLDQEDIDLLEWLLLEHLTLSRVAQKEDINNPEVIQSFVDRIPSERALIALYLLTIADVRATNPKLWNPWRAHLFKDLFQKALANYKHQSSPVDLLKEIQEQALQLCEPPHSRPAFWSTLKAQYFYAYCPDELAWHIKVLLSHQQDKPFIVSRLFRGTWQFFIHWNDQPAIFSYLNAFLSARRLAVVEVKIVTASDGWTFNSFSVLEPEYEYYPEEMYEVCEKLTAFLKEVSSNPEVLLSYMATQQRLPRRLQALPLHPEIQLNPDMHHANRFLLHIVAADRDGLWADIAYCLWTTGIIVHGARIQNLGERAEGTLNISGARLYLLNDQARLEANLFKLLYPL